MALITYKKLLLLAIALSSELCSADIDRGNCIFVSGYHGLQLSCNPNYLGIASCGASDSELCYNGNAAVLICCREIVAKQDKSRDRKACVTLAAEQPGGNMICPDDMVLYGSCSSGAAASCESDGGTYYTTVNCCDDHSQLLTSDCFWVYADDSTLAVCPDGSVGRGLCGSGIGAECNGSYHGVHCCNYQ